MSPKATVATEKQLKKTFSSESYVYFVNAPAIGCLKIGTARDVNVRLSELRTSSPTELELVGSVKGDREMEKQLHSRFKHLRKHREWFDYCDELRIHVEELIKGGA